jgi:hypothetical protein
MSRAVQASVIAFLAAAFPASRTLAGASGLGAQPISIEAPEDVSASSLGAPHLQSSAWTQWDGKWIFIAGRPGGYHGAGQGDVNFPRAGAKQRIWVIEPPCCGCREGV